jgi:carotenoid cleavage dioxygenase-like enzyme
MLGFRSLSTEVTDEPLPVEGTIPGWLSGTLVRNGPGKFEVGQTRVNHWFDGLAMLRKFELGGGEVSLTNRFLRTEAYRDARAGRAVGQFATDESGWRKVAGWLGRLGPPEPTDNANVHVARMDGDLVALTEVPRWIAVDGDSLATRGEVRFADDLDLDMTTAHLRRDPAAGEYLGFGLRFGSRHAYEVFRIPDGTRHRERIATIPTANPAYIHDCALTEQHVVLAETPLRIEAVRALSPATEGFLDLLEWHPELGTRFLVVDRETGTVVAEPTGPPVFAFHVVNAFEDGGDVVLDLIDYADHGIVDALRLDALEREGFAGVPAGRLVRYRLNNGSLRRERRHTGMELPTVPRAVRAREYRYAYGQATDRAGANGLVKVDVETGEAREWWEDDLYVEEPRVVRRPDAEREDDGVILAPALDVDGEHTVLLVLDATSLEERARARLPHCHPFGFHGRFFPTAP